MMETSLKPSVEEYPRPPSESGILFLRGLPWGSSVEEVKAFFEPLPVSEVVIVNSRERGPTGEAFVRLENAEDMADALERHAKPLGKRYIEVHASDEQGFALRVKESGVRDCSAGWLRCRGLPFTYTAQDVADVFKDFAVAKEDVTVCVHRSGAYAGCKNGEAWVKCADQDTALKAQLALHMSTVGHGQRYIELYLLSEAERLSADELPDPERQQRQFVEQLSSCLLRARGLPFKSSVADVVRFFSGYGVDHRQVLMLSKPDGKPKGEALVWMASQDRATAARKELNLKKLGRRYVELLAPGASEISTALAMSSISYVCVPCTYTGQTCENTPAQPGSQCSGSFVWPGTPLYVDSYGQQAYMLLTTSSPCPPAETEGPCQQPESQ